MLNATVPIEWMFDVCWQVPFYKGEHIKFDVMPNRLPLSVEHDSVVIAVTEECWVIKIILCNLVMLNTVLMEELSAIGI